VAELERSNARLEESAQAIAHDLREGLGTIAMFRETLARRLGPGRDPSAARELEGIGAGIERMSSLIDATLESARRGTVAARRPVATDLALDDALANLAARIAETDAKIVREPLPWTSGDPQELTRLFQNLIANALEHRDPERAPRIRIGARRDGAGWLFEVADNGPGMPPEVSRAFERGEAANGVERRLGLEICARIVAAHGGRAWAARRPEGGTMVSFTLPGPTGPRTSATR
jgi:signal transduction histidine kinase